MTGRQRGVPPKADWLSPAPAPVPATSVPLEPVPALPSALPTAGFLGQQRVPAVQRYSLFRDDTPERSQMTELSGEQLPSLGSPLPLSAD